MVPKTQTSIMFAWQQRNIYLFFLFFEFLRLFQWRTECIFGRRTVCNKSVPAVLWPRGRFFQLYLHSQCLKTVTVLLSRDLHLCFFSSLQPAFLMLTVLQPLFFLPAISLAKPALCFYRQASQARFCPHRYCWESLPVGDRFEVDSEKCCVWCRIAHLNQ